MRLLSRRRAGGVVYALAVQYFVAEVVTASRWRDPAYSWTGNYISDLGLPDCSPLLCSPAHLVMNTALVAQGTIIATGSLLLAAALPAGRLRTIAVSLMVMSGVGDVLVATFPGSVEEVASAADRVHTLGAALAIFGGNAGIVATGLALRRARRHPHVAGFSLASGGLGLVALALFGTGHDLGLGVGTMERLAADPIIVWLIAVGLLVVATPSPDQEATAPPASRASRKRLRSMPPA